MYAAESPQQLPDQRDLRQGHLQGPDNVSRLQQPMLRLRREDTKVQGQGRSELALFYILKNIYINFFFFIIIF